MRGLYLAAALAYASDGFATEPAPPVVLPRVEVVATTPLPGLEMPLKLVPANVQIFDARDIGRQRPSHLAEFLDSDASGVNVNAASGNPFQVDVNFRGFTASPLLGTPQGLSVFVDGVRVNEVFGDVVNWDLIPVSAIASVQVMPGSNPIYGLNTLGGALAVTTKDGRQFPGGMLEAAAGAFGRRSATAAAGGRGGPFDFFLTGHASDEDGFREHSASRVRQFFAKSAYRSDADELEGSLALADTALQGTQALPVSMLNRPREAYTWPDGTTNRLLALNLQARHALQGDDNLVAGLYYRGLDSRGVNSNVNAEALATPDAPDAFNVDSSTVSRGSGASVQWTSRPAGLQMQHRLTTGATADFGSTDFEQFSEPARFSRDRETLAIGPGTRETAARTGTRQLGLFALDAITLTDHLATTVSARYQSARIVITDRSGMAPALDGTHRYQRVTAAAGTTYQVTPSTTIYANWSEGMRVPTAAELTCADPSAPCSLPNIFVADPPLKAVLGTTVEAGARGRWPAMSGRFAAWSVAGYRTALRDDIQFIATGTGAVNTGYFTNIGGTARTGAELGASVPLGAVTLGARFSYTRATFDTTFREHSPNNATADSDGAITIHRGNRIPGIPAQLLKLRADWTVTPVVEVGMSMNAASAQYAHGNENNADPAGRVPGYVVFNLDAAWRMAPGWELVANLVNVLDRRYQTFGTLGSNFFRGPGDTFAPELALAEAFRGVAAPRAAWVAVRFTWDDAR